MDKYLKAIKQNICAICVDSNEKGRCTLNEKETCAVELFLPKIIDIIQNNENEELTKIYKNIKESVCAECLVQNPDGYCYLREDANCSLDRYFYLIVETIQKVDAGILT
ncbi:MAG: hypothetical protein AB1432_00975 [Bacteroidota bacterium]|jgi:hypothetical protein